MEVWVTIIVKKENGNSEMVVMAVVRRDERDKTNEGEAMGYIGD